jgi:hypothetical protein
MLTAFVLGAFSCGGFAPEQCDAWRTHAEQVVGQSVDGFVNRGPGHSAELHLEVKGFSASEHVDYTERVDRVLDAMSRDLRSKLDYVPRSTHKIQYLLGAAEIGLALAVMGSVFYGISQADAGLLSTDVMQSEGQVDATAAQGRVFQPAGATLLSIGLAVIAGALIWLIIGATP